MGLLRVEFEFRFRDGRNRIVVGPFECHVSGEPYRNPYFQSDYLIVLYQIRQLVPTPHLLAFLLGFYKVGEFELFLVVHEFPHREEGSFWGLAHYFKSLRTSSMYDFASFAVWYAPLIFSLSSSTSLSSSLTFSLRESISSCMEGKIRKYKSR